MFFKTTDHAELHYDMTGQGFPLVMLNGLWGDISMWDHQVKDLAADYCCIRLDHRGLAKSEKWQGSYSYALHARDVRDLLDHLQISQCILLGVCHGGMTAVTFAKNYPDRVRALIINGTQLLTSVKQRKVFEGWKNLIQLTGFKNTYQFMILQSVFSESFIAKNEDRIEAMVAATVARVEEKSAVKLIEACMAYGFESEDIENMKVPALIMSGDEDCFIPQRVIEQDAKLWKGSEYHSFVNCGHVPQREAGDSYNLVLRRYLSHCLKTSALNDSLN